MAKDLKIGERVFLATDPRRDGGVVKDIVHARYFVCWDNGRTWVYPGVDLKREKNHG